MSHQSEELKPTIVNGNKITGIWAFLNMIGGVSGLLSLLVVALMGGEIKRQVAINTEDIKNIQATGSPTLQAAVKALTLEIESRKDSDAATNKRVDDLRVDFSQRISNITQLLEKLVEQQTQLIALIKAQQQIH